MSQRALKLAGADLAQAPRLAASKTEADRVAREAARMAKLAGQFSLFGLRIDVPEPTPKLSLEALEHFPSNPGRLSGTENAQNQNVRPLSDGKPDPTPDFIRGGLEAARLAELAGAFGLFGLAIDQPEDAWPKDACLEPADLAYRIEDMPGLEWFPKSVTRFSDENRSNYRCRPVVPDCSGLDPGQAGTGLAPANDADRVPAQRPALPELKRRGAHIEPHFAIKAIQAIDWVVVALAAEFAARWGAGAGLAELSLGRAAVFVLSAVALKAGLWLTESYRVPLARLRPEHGIGGLAIGTILGIVLANILAPDAQGAAALAATLPVAAMLLAGLHGALAAWIAAAHRAGVFAENIVLIGATDAAARFAARAAKTGEARILAIIDDRLARTPARIGGVPVAGALDDLLAWKSLPHIDRIVITVTQKADARVRAMIERLRVIPNRVDLLLDFETSGVRGRSAERFTGAAVACVSGRLHNARRALIKRSQDVIFGAALLAAFALPMLVIALAVKLDSKGPALYRQRRHGFNNRVITIVKFRTMRHDPDAPLRQVTANDPRFTRLGAFLRGASLDELPKLFNVLMGEMSLVGPCPHAIGMKAAGRELHHIAAEYAHRHRVKPGITGWAQVNGSRGPLETTAAVRRRLRLDIEYVANTSLWLDLHILLRTAPALWNGGRARR